MTPFTPDQWIILILIFVLGLLVGMFFMAGSKWKGRYREERSRCEALEAENEKLRREGREMDSLRNAAAKDAPREPEERRPL